MYCEWLCFLVVEITSRFLVYWTFICFFQELLFLMVLDICMLSERFVQYTILYREQIGAAGAKTCQLQKMMKALTVAFTYSITSTSWYPVCYVPWTPHPFSCRLSNVRNNGNNNSLKVFQSTDSSRRPLAKSYEVSTFTQYNYMYLCAEPLHSTIGCLLCCPE